MLASGLLPPPCNRRTAHFFSALPHLIIDARPPQATCLPSRPRRLCLPERRFTYLEVASGLSTSSPAPRISQLRILFRCYSNCGITRVSPRPASNTIPGSTYVWSPASPASLNYQPLVSIPYLALFTPLASCKHQPTLQSSRLRPLTIP